LTGRRGRLVLPHETEIHRGARRDQNSSNDQFAHNSKTGRVSVPDCPDRSIERFREADANLCRRY
jgi:uncharacterized Fe-S cluster-containing protein